MENPIIRGAEYLRDAQDPSLDNETRFNTLDRARCCLLDARRNRMPPEQVIPLLLQVLEFCGNDRNPHCRALIGQIAEDLCMRELRSYCIPCTAALQRGLNDKHSLVVKRIIRTLTVLFRKVMGLVVSTGIGHGLFPDAAFAAWRNMQSQAVLAINSNDPGIQKAATKFAETAVLALSYSGSRPTPEHFTLDYAAHRRHSHPMLIIDELENEGKRIVALVAGLIYASFGMPCPSGLAPPKQISHAALVTAFSVIGNLIKRRGKLLPMTVPALLAAVAAISNGAESFMKFSEGQRWTLIKMIKHSLKMVLAFPHIMSNRDILDAQASIRRIDDKLKHEKYMRSHRHSRSSRHDGRDRMHRNAPPGVASNTIHEQPGSMKRPRAGRENLQLVPPQVAWDYSQFLVSSMPPNEIAHFVMTRLILDTPPIHIPSAPPVPSVQEPNQRANKRTKTEPEERPVEPRRPVRRHAPPVVKLKLTDDGIDRLYNRCCKSLLMREAVAKASGADPLRTLVLSGLLARVAMMKSDNAWKLCKEVIEFIAQKIDTRRELALSWLHFVLSAYDDNRAKTHQAQNTVTDTEVVKTDDSVAIDVVDDVPSNSNGKLATDNAKTEMELVENQKDDVRDANNKTQSKEEPSTVETSAAPSGDTKVKNDAIDSQMKDVEQNTAASASVGDTEPNGKVIDGNLGPGNGVAELKGDELLEDEENTPGGDLTKCEAYMRLFQALFDELIANPKVDDTQVRRMIVDAPIIPASVMEMLRDACRDVERAEFALGALRDIILERAGNDRSDALEAVLELAVDKDDVIRGPTIRLVAGSLYSELAPATRCRIEAFAFDGLSLAIASAQEDTAENQAHLEHRSWLVAALCAQKHSLIHRIADAYVGASNKAKNVLLERAKVLSGQLGAEAPAVAELVANGKKGGEEFALSILGGVVKKYGRPAKPIVDAGCARFSATTDARFLEAVVTGMTRDQLVKHLADLVKYCAKDAPLDTPNATSVTADADEATSAAKPFAKLWRTVMEAHPPALTPSDLLVALHTLPDEKATHAAVRACFELRAIYKHAVVAQALQTLVGQTTLSPMLMRTGLLMRAFYDNVDEYLGETIVVPLIRRRLWTIDGLWMRFLDYCAVLKERCVKILLRLPAPQLEQALKTRFELVENFRALVANQKAIKKIPVIKRRVVISALKTMGQN